MAIIKHQSPGFYSGSLLPDFFDNSLWGGNPGFPRAEMPAVNIRETDTAYKIEVAAPGIPKENIHVRVDNKMLVIEGENKYEDETKDGQYTRKEFGSTSFQRRFAIPDQVNPEKIEAKGQDGVVNITLPKSEDGKVKSSKEIKIL